MLLRACATVLLFLASSSFAEVSKERDWALSSIEERLANGGTPRRLEKFRREIESDVAAHPENLPVLYADPSFRAWFTLRRLIDWPVRDLEALSPRLADAHQLTRVLAALQFAHAGRDAALFIDYALSALVGGFFESSLFVLEDKSSLTLDDVEGLLEVLVRLIGAVPGDTSPLRARLRELPSPPTSLERTAFGANYEILRLGLLLGDQLDDDERMIRALAPLVVDSASPRNIKLAAARRLGRLEIAHPAKVELEQVLKWQFGQSQPRPRWWTFFPPERPDFFRAQQGLAVDLFRLWRSRDADFLKYLLDAAEGRGRGEMTPAHVADTLIDLELRDDRFLPFLSRNLAKTGAKNMPLFFRALVTLWPDRSRDIMTALHQVHTVPELISAYLTDLVAQAEREPKLLEALRGALDGGRVPLDQQVMVADLRLDVWIERAIARRRPCDSSLGNSTPTIKDDEHAQD